MEELSLSSSMNSVIGVSITFTPKCSHSCRSRKSSAGSTARSCLERMLAPHALEEDADAPVPHAVAEEHEVAVADFC